MEIQKVIVLLIKIILDSINSKCATKKYSPSTSPTVSITDTLSIHYTHPAATSSINYYTHPSPTYIPPCTILALQYIQTWIVYNEIIDLCFVHSSFISAFIKTIV